MTNLLTDNSTNQEFYWRETRRPLVCLLFLTPLLFYYEWGLWQAGAERSALYRNGADYWMREALAYVGLAQPLLLPLLVIVILLLWHISRRERWQLSAETLWGMLAESILFAFVLLVLGQLQELAFQQFGIPRILSVASSGSVISYVGAGIYEEVLFRLCLLPILFYLFRGFTMSNRASACSAVLVSSLIFSGAHYVGPVGDTWSLFSFSFRTLAGIFFAGLFVLRGFGITVGCHAIYDLLVGVLLATSQS